MLAIDARSAAAATQRLALIMRIGAMAAV